MEDIEALVKQLKKGGVVILDEIAQYAYGKFVHVPEPGGVEPWGPADDFGQENVVYQV